MVVILLNAGDQRPEMLLLDNVGSVANTPPSQTGATASKEGISNGTEFEQELKSGINVYVVVTLVSKAGVQNQEILLFEVVGNKLLLSPAESALIL